MTPKQLRAKRVNIKAAIAASPWRKQNIVGTKRSTECAEYIAQRRKAGDVPRPLTELDP